MNWQPIETAPKDGTVFLTYVPDHGWSADKDYCYDLAWWDLEDECWCKPKCGFRFVTHWRPLPEPPE